MKILLTGGAGYIGAHVAVALHKNGFTPVIIDNFSNSFESVIQAIGDITGMLPVLYKDDCRNEEALSRILEREGDIVGAIHFAAYKAVGESVNNPLKYYDNNINTTLSLIKAMRSAGIGNLVFSSSCTVYGETDEQPVTEETVWKEAFSPYGYTKQVCERLLHDFFKSAPDSKLVSLRYFNPIGAHPSAKIGEFPLGTPNNLVPYITQVAAGWRERLTIYGKDYNTKDGTCVRDYIHVCDLADAHVAALKFLLDHEDGILETFNVGTGKGVSVKEIVESFEKATGRKIDYRYGDRRPGDVATIFANADKARKILNWKTKFSVSEALEHAWNWQQNQKEP